MRTNRSILLLCSLSLLLLVPVGESFAESDVNAEVFLPLVANIAPQGIFMSQAEIRGLPTSGAAWRNVLEYAQQSASPKLSDRKDQTDAVVFAKALVYVRTGNASYRAEVVQAIKAIIGTEGNSDLLALSRNLTAYVVAADLVGFDGSDAAAFQQWLRAVRHKRFDDRSIVSTHEERANNWGTHAGAARIAIAIYLNDTQDLQRAARVFQGWTGDRGAYAGFKYTNDLSWHCDPARPVPVNPTGCHIGGHNVDGVLPEDQRRGGPFQWPPPKENYVWEALQGVVAQARMLERAGYPAFSWSNQALRRAALWLQEGAQYPAIGDDSGVPWLINSVYGANLPVQSPARPGKNGLGFYDWLTGAR